MIKEIVSQKNKFFVFLIAILMISSFWGTFSISGSVAEYDQKISDMYVSRTDGEDLWWELKADEALVQSNGEHALLSRVNLHYFLLCGNDVIMRADQAEVDFSQNQIFIQGGIRAESQQGITMQTQSLLWNGSHRSISTQDWVIIKRASIEIYGHGLEADLDLERIKIKSDAKTVIY